MNGFTLTTSLLLQARRVPMVSPVVKKKKSPRWTSTFPSIGGHFLGGPSGFHLMGITGGIGWDGSQRIR